jgi:hypothetical protein
LQLFLKVEIQQEKEVLSKGYRSILPQDFAGLPPFQSQLKGKNPSGISRDM